MSSAPAFIDPYLDPETGLLKNLLNLRDADSLRRAEADYSTLGLVTLLQSDYALSYEPADLSNIHFELFGAVYPWAGEFRTVEIRKGRGSESPIFMPSSNIERSLSIFLAELDDADRLVGLEDDEFCRSLASRFNDLNYIHPFREGNGRTQRVFWSLVANEGGRRIDWPSISGPELDHASELARTMEDTSELVSLFERTVSYIDASLETRAQLLVDLASGMHHDSYDAYDRYGKGSYYSL